ncbi:TNF receptor-associated factor 2-like isoform X2 [Amblyomma americanum]
MEKQKGIAKKTILYRDLPGGPRKLEFVQEISLRWLCPVCRMLSLSMYQDPGGHTFCGTCLHTFIDKFGKDCVYCRLCCKHVNIDKMYQALHPLTELRELYVDCPNRPQCRVKIPLEDLKAHYVVCKPEVKCSVCCQGVRSTDWDEHKSCCEKGSDPRETVKNHSAAGETTKKSLLCEHCRRPVQEVNMPRHLEKCSEAPKTCAYCDRRLPKQDMATTCAALRTSEPETKDGNTKAQGSCTLEKIPELPTLALSDEDMKTWHDAFEEHLSMLRINDNHRKYQLLLSALAPDIIQKVGKSETYPPPGREYKWLVELLFQLSSSARRKKYFQDIIKKKLNQERKLWRNIFSTV